MTLENTIQAMFDRHPTLFKDREDCFNQLFCSGGEDYEGKDGELVDCYTDDAVPINRLKDGKAFRYNRMGIYDEELALAGELGLTGVSAILQKRIQGPETGLLYISVRAMS